MTHKLMSVVVRGRDKTYSFLTYQDPKYLPEYLAQGLDVQLVENTVPDYKFITQSRIFLRAWCFAQDVWNLKNPFKFYWNLENESKNKKESK